MIALLAAIVFAQTAAIQIGGKPDTSVATAVRREARRDSLRARERARDSVRKATRLAKRPPMTDAVMRSAFKDLRAYDILTRARASRLEQDTTLNAYEVDSYERMSVGMGFTKIGRERLLMRSERAAHVRW